MRALLAALVLALISAGNAFAAGAGQGQILVEDAWARATIGAVRNSAAYMTLVNRGDVPDRLVAVEAPAARAELHTHLHDEQGVVRMRPVAAIEVAPGEATVLQPGGLHIMLVDLERPLQAGDRVALTLVFERAGRIDLELPVRDLRGHGTH